MPPEKPTTLGDRLIIILAPALICGLLLGGFFAYINGGFLRLHTSNSYQRHEASDKIYHDPRTPYEAYYRPFLIGFAIGVFIPSAYNLTLGRKK